MTPKRSGRRPGTEGQPTVGAPLARGPRPASRVANRALDSASTRGSGLAGRRPLLLWSLVFVAVAAVVVVSAIFLSQPSGGGTSGLQPPTVITPANIPANGRTLGQPNAPVTIDLYGDFRCSACFGLTTGGTESDLVTNYIATGKARLVWHDLLTIDLVRGGTASRDAANAAWCAADQGKFWTMHDWLYANDEYPTEAASAFTASRLSDIARAAGLDMSKYQPCFDAGTHDADIAAEQSSTPSEAGGTPTVFVAGKFVGTAGYVPTYQQISAAIDAALGSTPSSSPSASPS